MACEISLAVDPRDRALHIAILRLSGERHRRRERWLLSINDSHH